MGISTYHIHNVLKTYTKKLRKGTQRSDKGNAARPKRKDWVVVSTRTRRKAVIEKVTSDIAHRIIRRSHRHRVEPELSAQPGSGKKNEPPMKKEDAELVYKVIDGEKGNETKTLHIQSPEFLQNQLEETTENNNASH
jgi:hypothetical protein